MADIKGDEKSKVVMILCPIAGKLEQLAEVAAEQLEKEGFGKITTVSAIVNERLESSRILLVESGYGDSHLEVMKVKLIRVDHHLVLKDLGLDEDTEFSAESVELVRDGMVAECVVIGSQSPKFNCPCGFSK